jgi:hypothetical protein
MPRRAACTLLVGVVFVAGAGAQPADVRALIDRVSAYVETFEKNFGSVVSEERYEQSVRRALGSSTTTTRGGTVPMQTVLRSDFLLVQVPGEGWLPFRDVFERDGKPVRDREERLASIFLTGGRNALEQAQAVMNEGARYNIGNVSRNINTPTLALVLLTPKHRHRLRFEPGRRKEGDPGLPIAFTETGRPTFISTASGPNMPQRDLPVQGTIWVDETTGTVYRTELEAIDTGVEAVITVTYERDETIGFVVPSRMEERYRRPRDPMEVRGVATYSRFRRFQVSTSEELAR